MLVSIDALAGEACPPAPRPPLRSLRERVIQTLGFGAGGLLLVAPLYAALFGADAATSVFLLVVLALLVMLWSPFHNFLFDYLEARICRRVASDRPHRLRLVHAVSHEATSVVLTLPAVMWIGGHGFWTALAVDIGLTLAYALYAYVFHLGFDWLRPVARETKP
jgi:uncharacterized membrane protein